MVPPNRYSELLAQIPRGSFYQYDGIILPVHDAPWQLQLSTPSPNTIYEVFVDQLSVDFVSTDSLGNVTISVLLSRGEHVITLISGANPTTPLTSYVTILDYAVWLAAYADIFNSIDAGVTAVQDNTYLNSATADQISTIWGQRSGYQNTVQYSADAYRDTLQQIRQCQRRFGGSFAGIELGVASVTTVNPLIIQHQFAGPRWILGWDRTFNNNLLQSTRVTASALTNLNSNGGNYTVQSLSSDTTIGTGIVSYNHTSHTLSWTVPSAGYFHAINTLTNSPPYTLSPYLPKGRLCSLPGPFTMPAGSDTCGIKISLDGLTPIAISLGATGAVLTANNIAATILAAFFADATSPYAAYSGANVAADPAGRLEFVSLHVGQNLGLPNPGLGSITIWPYDTSLGQDAAQVIWGIPWAYTLVASNTSAGSLVLSVNSAVALPTPTAQAPVSLLVGRINNGSTPITPFIAVATSVSSNVYTLDAPGLLGNVYAGASVELAGQVPYTVQPPRQPTLPISGEAIVIAGSGPFPTVNTNDSVVVVGSTAPDGWILSSNATGTITDDASSRWYAYAMQASNSADVLFSTSLNISVADYVGYNINLLFSCKLNQYAIRNTSPSAGAVIAATLPAQTVVAGISFDEGATWVEGTPVTLGNTVVLLPVQVALDTTIPPGATTPQIRLRWITPTPMVWIFVEEVHLTIDDIDGLYLGQNTIPRSEQIAKQGAYMYIWSPDQLSPAEYTLLGCPPSPQSLNLPAPAAGSGLSGWTIPATVTPTTPFTGVTVAQATNGTPVGNGLLVFTTGSPSTLAFQAPGDTIPGSAVSLPSDGFYVIFNQSGVYSLTVEVTTASLPSTSSSQILTIGFIDGLIQDLAPSNVSLAPYDISFYGNGTLSSNIAGAFNEATFLLGEMTNLEVAVRSPARFTHMAPTVISKVTDENISFTATGPYTASLANVSDEIQTNAVLFEGPNPVPNNLWSFSEPQQITLSYTPLSVQYSINYGTLIQFISAPIDAGAQFADYAWYVDWYAYQRANVAITSVPVTYGMTFNQNLNASLPEPSDQNQANSTLQQDNGQTITIIPTTQWSYVDPNTININTSTFDPTSVYQLTYLAQSPEVGFGPSVTVLYAGASTIAGLSTASFAEVTINQPIGNIYRYHQFIVNISNVTDLRDIRLYNCMIKGLPLYTGSPTPGLPATYW